jgi:hypothetical protein
MVDLHFMGSIVKMTLLLESFDSFNVHGVVHAYLDKKLLISIKIKGFNQQPKHIGAIPKLFLCL